jgi:hypothetical protein
MQRIDSIRERSLVTEQTKDSDVRVLLFVFNDTHDSSSCADGGASGMPV